jgi:hypothetical protein
MTTYNIMDVFCTDMGGRGRLPFVPSPQTNYWIFCMDKGATHIKIQCRVIRENWPLNNLIALYKLSCLCYFERLRMNNKGKCQTKRSDLFQHINAILAWRKKRKPRKCSKDDVFYFISKLFPNIPQVLHHLNLCNIEIPRRRWVDNIKMDLKDIRCNGMEWIHLA